MPSYAPPHASGPTSARSAPPTCLNGRINVGSKCLCVADSVAPREPPMGTDPLTRFLDRRACWSRPAVCYRRWPVDDMLRQVTIIEVGQMAASVS